jgi:hypothetical protein
MMRCVRTTVAVLLVAGAAGSGCAAVEDEDTHSEYEPAVLQPITGSDAKRVVLTAEGARRIGLQTAPVQRDGARRRVLPTAAVLYDEEGAPFTYTNPAPLTFVRVKLAITNVAHRRAVLSAGPPVGTAVVTTGAAEVYGTEFEVDH